MVIEYNAEIMKWNDIIDDYKFEVICDTENLISMINSVENAMKIFLKDWHEEFLNKKCVIVTVRKNSNLIACLKITCFGYVEDICGYKSKIPVDYEEFSVEYEEEIVIENWGKKKNLRFIFPTQEEIEELLRS